MVVIAPSRDCHERGDAHHDVEPDHIAVEGDCRLQLGDGEVHVPHDRLGSESNPGLRPLPACGDYPFNIHRVHRHLHHAIANRPHRPGTIGIDLEAIAIGVVEIQDSLTAWSDIPRSG